jgi:hypothetical protein
MAATQAGKPVEQQNSSNRRKCDQAATLGRAHKT